jgi:squalene synthase HpnC
MTRQAAPPPPAVSPAGLTELRHAENFSVAAAWIPRRERRLLLAVYTYSRFVDEVGDGGRRDALEILDAIEHDVRAGAGGPAYLPELRPVLQELEEGGLPREPLLDLIEANRRDQQVHRYETFQDLIAYCRLSADPVGRLVLAIMGASNAVTRPLSDAICSALQVVEHLQDVREDAHRGRIYLPGADLEAEGVSEAELADAPRASRGLRRVVALQAARARSMLVAGSPLVGMLRGWRRPAVAGYAAGGLAAISALAAADYDILGGSPRPGKGARAVETARLALRGRAR